MNHTHHSDLYNVHTIIIIIYIYYVFTVRPLIYQISFNSSDGKSNYFLTSNPYSYLKHKFLHFIKKDSYVKLTMKSQWLSTSNFSFLECKNKRSTLMMSIQNTR